ncbi:MAG: 4Fe-4S binding protein [Myxococcaceae bacterium]|nr:4Fe-4S binding protein [Myxococcaceae bacterium]
MSQPAEISRRALLGLFRKREQPATPAPVAPAPPVGLPPASAFSLEAFYAARRSVPALGAVVSVRPQLCLAWQGSFCSTCAERCPVEGAIALDAGRPRVVAERCNGCGVCVRVCPAPLNAFELRPAGSPGGSS